MPALVWKFLKDRRGFTTVEAALWLSFLIPLTLAYAEVQRYNRIGRHLRAAADGFAALVATRTDHPNVAPGLTAESIAVAGVFPEVVADHASHWREKIGIQAARVSFDPSHTQASPVWIWNDSDRSGLLQERGLQRDCAAHYSPGGAGASAATVPADAFGPDEQIVVELVYRFSPLVLSGIARLRPLVFQAHYKASPGWIDPAMDASDGVIRCAQS